MNRFRRFSFSFTLIALLVLASDSLALARGQKAAPAAAPSGKSYGTAYLIVGLCMGLGLAAVLRPTNRSKPE